MRLTILGCNGTYPTPGRPSSGYLIESDSATVWLDCGTGTFASLQEHIDPTRLDAIVISHEHVDHCVDVLPYAYARRYGHPDLPPVPVFAPPSVPRRLEAFIGRQGSAVFEALAFQSMGANAHVSIGDLDISFIEANHPVPTLAAKIASPKGTIAYTADTGPCEAMVGWAAGVDILLAEASYQGAAEDKPWPHHLTAGEAGELAARNQVGQLVLTHLWPTNDPEISVSEASAAFSGRVVAAAAGQIFDLEERHVTT